MLVNEKLVSPQVFGNKVIVVNVDGCWGQNRTLQIQSDCHWKVVYYFEVVMFQDFILSLMISINIAFAKIVVGILLVNILLENLRFVGSEWSKHTSVPGVRREGFAFVSGVYVNFKRFIVFVFPES